MSSYLRPDELASEEKKRRAGNISNTIISGSKALAGGYAASRILPFLSEHIPLNLALKGINKVAPAIGKFLSDGQKMGLDVKEGLDFIKDDLSKSEQPKESRNIIQQYSPELHSFITEEIGKGRKPLEAGALAQLNGKFSKAIKKMEEDHKTQFSTILQSTYGAGESKGMSKEDALKKFIGRKKSNLPNELTQQFDGYYGAQQPQQQDNQQGQGGQGQQALMSIMQKIMQQLGQ